MNYLGLFQITRSLRQRSSRRPDCRPMHFQPQVESLEQRQVLSGLIHAGIAPLGPLEFQFGQIVRPFIRELNDNGRLDDRVDAGRFSNASLLGVYTIVVTGGDHDGTALGRITYDGRGELGGFFDVNGPFSDEERRLFRTPLVGSYDVNADGTASQKWTMVETPMGEIEFDMDLLITEANGRSATEVTGAFRQPSPFVPGALVTFELKKIDAFSVFSNASLRGTYAIVVTGGGHDGTALGHVNYDGHGELSGFFDVNGPFSDEERRLFRTPLVGSYDVNSDGTVSQKWTMTDTPMGPLDFDMDVLITEASGRAAREATGAFRQPSPFVPGSLVTFELHKISDLAVSTNSSLRGIYTIVLNGGDHDGAALGRVAYDGRGALRGFFTVNGPNTEDERRLFRTPLIGSYEVQPDGTISQSWTMTDTPMGELEFDMDMLITETTGRTASEVAGAFRQPSPFVSGALITFDLTRVDNRFREASLRGTYAIVVTGGPHDGTALGRVTYDGRGNLRGFFDVNGPLSDEERRLFRTPLVGTYEVFGDGTLTQQWTMTETPIGPLQFDMDLVITGAKGRSATEVAGAFREPSPFVPGALVTFELKRID